MALPLPDDEGYEHLLPVAPTLDDMRSYFTHALDDLQVQAFMQAQAAKTEINRDKKSRK